MQMREIRSGESYGIQNSLTAHFGIGTSTSIDSAVIHWPSGTIDHLDDLNANQFIYAIEGGGDPTGINELNVESISLSIYPNPANQYIILDLDDKYNSASIYIQIISIQGQVMVEMNNIKPKQKISIESLESGTYIVNAFIDNTKISRKLTVK
jgi:hypothetical protein